MNDVAGTDKRQAAPVMLFGYIATFFAVLVVILEKAYPAQGDAAAWMNCGNWVTLDGGPAALALYAAGVLAFVGAFTVPPLVARRNVAAAAAAPGAPKNAVPNMAFLAPYIIRLCLFEAVAIMGFIIAFLGKSPPLIAPLLVIGLAGLAVSLPTKGFFERFAARV